MAHALKPHGATKWTVVTYLPFLWHPEKHMFLKPQVTKKFAEKVGHPFEHAYSSDLDAKVYVSLLDLVEETKAELTDLAPRDNIDVQSFIWVVGAYTDKDERLLREAEAKQLATTAGSANKSDQRRDAP